MKRLFVITAILLLIPLQGCGNPAPTPPGTTPPIPNTNKPLIVAAIGAAAEIGTNQGLRALAKNNPAAANETAMSLRQAIDTTILPYLNGGTVVTAVEVQRLLNSSLFVGVDPAIRNAIAAAASVLDAYLPVPGAATVLSQDHIDYIKAFLTGITKGCTDFLPGRVPRNLQRRWIEVPE